MASVSKFGLSVSLGSASTIISNAYDITAATDMAKPTSTGVQILKSGLFIVLGRFSITTPNSAGRCGVGVRLWKSDSDYSDNTDSLISGGKITNTYTYVRMSYYDAGIYLRPIAYASDGGTCSGCNLTVASLKSGR